MSGISGFIERLKRVSKKRNQVLYYRGHSDSANYKLLPYLFRKADVYRNESRIFRMLLASHPQEFRDDMSTFEKLVRMQHYSLPTRLLDITSTPLTALYFALSDKAKDSTEGEVIVFKIPEKTVKFFDSDTVSCLSNLAFLNPTERNNIRKLIKEDLTVTEFNNEPAVKRLHQFIKAEKPYFLPEIIPDDLRKVVFAVPKLSNKRILAQNGAFIVFGLTGELDEENDLGIEIERIEITPDDKKEIRKDLDLFGYNKSFLFPEIESSAQYITSKFDIPMIPFSRKLR